MIRRLNQQHIKCLRFLATDLRDPLYVTANAFMILVLLGFVYGLCFPQQTNDYIQQMSQQINSSGIVSEDGMIDVVDLFSRNVMTLSMTLLYGFLPILYLPALPLGINATLLGLMAAYYIHNDISLLVYLAALVPHGIFELPTMVLCFTLALHLCRSMTQQSRKPELSKAFGPTLKNILRVHLLCVIPLLAVSAIIECYITPAVMGLLI